MPQSVVSAVSDYINLEARIGGYEAAAERSDEIEAAYGAVGKLVGAGAKNIAFTENATVSYATALSAIPFQRGDVLLTTANDYASNQIQFLSLQSRVGIEVVRAPESDQGGVDLDAMRRLIRTRTPRLVCVTHVPTNSGLVQDVAAVGEMCREAGVVYLVDACQSVGQMPVDVASIHCDFLSATARKFLRGPRGSGFLFVSDRILDEGLEPLFVDMRGADWIGADQYAPVKSAKRFENWEFAWALVLGTAAAAEYALAVGIDDIWARTRALAERTRTRLAEIPGVKVLDRGDTLCGIVSLQLDQCDPASVVDALRRRNINTSSQTRVSAVIDYDAKGVDASLRVSPHYFNTEDEIEVAAVALAEVISAA